MNKQVMPHQAQNKQRLSISQPLLIIIVVSVLVIAVAWTLSSMGVLPPFWAIFFSALFTIISVATGIWQSIRRSSDNAIVINEPHITVNVPQLPFIQDSYQNDKTIEAIYEILQKADTTALALSGVSGIGKSTIAAQVYQYAEAQRSSGKDTRFNAQPLWLCVDAATTISSLVSSIMRSLDKLVPGFNMLPPQNQIFSLINAFDTLPEDESRLVFLDQFEHLLGKEAFSQDNSGADMLLDVLNRHIFGNPRCCVVFTSRGNLAQIDGYRLEYVQEYRLKGLSETESLEFLKTLSGSELEAKEREKAVGNYRGHPLSLALLASIVKFNKTLSLSELVARHTHEHFIHGNPTEQLLEYIYQEQLDPVQRQLLLAFSLYREPVSVQAAHAASFPASDTSQEVLQRALQRLLGHHLLLPMEQGYGPHPLVAKFAHRQFESGRDLNNPYTLVAAHARVAGYYENQVNDAGRGSGMLFAFIEAAWHNCMATQWAKAYELMEKGKLLSRLPFSTRGVTILLELYTLLFPLNKWRPDRSQTAKIHNELGEVYVMLEMYEQSLPYFELALTLLRENHNLLDEARALCNLGHVHYKLGWEKLLWMNVEQEADVLRRAQGIPASTQYPITIYRYRKEISDIDHLLRQAVEYLEQALHIQESEDAYTAITGQVYYRLGQVYNLLRDQEQALRYFEKAVRLYREVGPRMEEARVLYDLGWLHNAQGSKQRGRAVELLNQTLFIQRELEDRRGEAATLDKLGRVYDDMDKALEAEGYYRQALYVEREIGDLMGAAITLHNMGMLYFNKGAPTEEMVAFVQQARRIFEEVHYPTPERVQRRLYSISSDHEKVVFADLWKDVAPRAVDIISRTLSNPPLLKETPQPAALSFALPNQYATPEDKAVSS